MVILHTKKWTLNVNRAMHDDCRKIANDFDAIIVGSGATGSWAAKLLTEGGLTALVLEAGHLPENINVAGRNFDRILGAPDAQRQLTQSNCYAFCPTTRHLFVDDIDQPYDTPTEKPFVWIRTHVIGGRTALWGRIALRMSGRQFAAASLDGFGVDWPIRYQDLRPHYEVAERFLAVTGLEAKLVEVPDGIFQPTALPTVGRMFQAAVERHFPDRVVTALRRARPTELKCTDASGLQPDKYVLTSSGSAALRAANSTGLMTLRPNARVSQVITDKSGARAEGIIYIDCLNGKEVEARGKVVILCASTIETTRIMLNSVSRPHPDGIGNFNGVLGKYLMDHVSLGASGLRLGPCHDIAEVYIPNFRNRDGLKMNFLRGYGIQGMLRPLDERTITCSLGCFGEVLPRAGNQVRLSNRKDKWGIPVPHITYEYSDNEFAMANDQKAELDKILQCSGFDVVSRHELGVPGTSIHEVGTARMGLDPKASVLNPHNQCWHVHNLFVADGAAFPTVGFQNPTLTMMAITGRACSHVLQEFARDRVRPFNSR